MYSIKIGEHVQNMNTLVLHYVSWLEVMAVLYIITSSLAYFIWVWYDDDRLIPLLYRPCIHERIVVF